METFTLAKLTAMLQMFLALGGSPEGTPHTTIPHKGQSYSLTCETSMSKSSHQVWRNGKKIEDVKTAQGGESSCFDDRDTVMPTYVEVWPM